jgi:hypothetical protein
VGESVGDVFGADVGAEVTGADVGKEVGAFVAHMHA